VKTLREEEWLKALSDQDPTGSRERSLLNQSLLLDLKPRLS
jgi:hypothetical protein